MEFQSYRYFILSILTFGIDRIKLRMREKCYLTEYVVSLIFLVITLFSLINLHHLPSSTPYPVN